MRTNIVGKILAAFICSGGLLACYVEAHTGPEREECRTTLHRTADVESCKTRCGAEECRTKCVEQERWSREHHCWME
jgi:hypothetical protein